MGSAIGIGKRRACAGRANGHGGDDERTARFYEFFAGGGMARAGLGDGWRCVFANDVDPKKAIAYADNWGSEGLHVGDVGQIKPAQLPGRADLVWAPSLARICRWQARARD